MPLEFSRNAVSLSGVCPAEEALELAEWLIKRKKPKIDLTACSHLHSSILQTLLAYRPSVSGEPKDPFIARWIMPMLAAAPSPPDKDSARP